MFKHASSGNVSVENLDSILAPWGGTIIFALGFIEITTHIGSTSFPFPSFFLESAAIFSSAAELSLYGNCQRVLQVTNSRYQIGVVP